MLQDSLTRKPCVSYNLISKRKARDIIAGVDNYFINILFFPGNNNNTTPVSNTVGINTLLKALPPVKELLKQDLTDYSSAVYTPNYKLDSVLVVTENGKQQTLRGVVYIRMFLLRSFGQVTPLQTNNFLLNAKAKKVKLSYENGVPYIVEKNAYCDYSNKLFLIDELPASGVLYMHKTARTCNNCAFYEQPEEFTFDPQKGITAIRCYVPALTDRGFTISTTYRNFKGY